MQQATKKLPYSNTDTLIVLSKLQLYSRNKFWGKETSNSNAQCLKIGNNKILTSVLPSLFIVETMLAGYNFAHTGEKGTAWTRLAPSLGHWFSIRGSPQENISPACFHLTFQWRQPLSLYSLTSTEYRCNARSWLHCVFWMLSLSSLFCHKTTFVCSCKTCMWVAFQPTKEVGSAVRLMPTSCPQPQSSNILHVRNTFAVENHCSRGSVRSYRTVPLGLTQCNTSVHALVWNPNPWLQQCTGRCTRDLQYTVVTICMLWNNTLLGI